MDEVKADLKKRMLDASEYEAKNSLIDQVMKHLIEKHKFEIPESVVASELKYMFEQFVHDLAKQGKKFEDTGIKVEQFIEQYKPAAENRVKGFYILDAIAKVEKIEATDKDVEDRIGATAAQINQPVEKVQEYYKTNNLLGGLKYQILHEKVLDFVISKAKIKTVKPKTTSKRSS
jgi:trigger factor